jgi:hypothetical protein
VDRRSGVLALLFGLPRLLPTMTAATLVMPAAVVVSATMVQTAMQITMGFDLRPLPLVLPGGWRGLASMELAAISHYGIETTRLFWTEHFMQSLIGTWKLVEACAFDENGKILSPPLGPKPMGIILYEAERMVVAVCDGRLIMPHGAAKRTFSSYTGKYNFDGEKLTVRVDGASSPDGFADQVRRIVFESSNRYVAVPLMPVLGRSSGLKLTWDRIS